MHHLVHDHHLTGLFGLTAQLTLVSLYTGEDQSINQMHFIKPFLHQQLSLSVFQIPSLRYQRESNAETEALWLVKLPRERNQNEHIL